MFPTGLSPSASPQMSHPHALSSSSANNNASSSPPGRTSRLRGLSYLRSYAHGGHHHQQSHSPAAPTVVTATNASTASSAQLSHGIAGTATATATATAGRRSSPTTEASSTPSPTTTTTPTTTITTTTTTAPTNISATSPSGSGASTSSSSTSTNTASNTTSTPNVWLPSSTGFNGLSRVATQTPAEISNSSVTVANGHPSSTPPAPGSTNASPISVIRPRSDSLQHLTQVRSIDEALAPQQSPLPSAQSPTPQVNATTATTPATSSTTPAVRAPSSSAVAGPSRFRNPGPMDPPAASIRFTPHIDIRSSREALTFTPVERILRVGDEVIRVGRYSERDNQPQARDPSGCNTAPVGFKSKVVSRRHCEFWYENGQWYVKDVKSSSGTFLNHIRLSAPGIESRAYPIYDGDILQLGIDFKGGEEPIFRCVKIRVELNRAWQKGLNNFNMSAHKRIRNMAASSRPQGDTASLHTSECSICLMSVAPCQALFVAPCSHVWHYKCIRPLVDKGYPVFLCPNCRAIADLERDIEEDELGMYTNNNNGTSDDGPGEGASTGSIRDGIEGMHIQDHTDEGEDGEAAGSAVGDAPTEIGMRGVGDETAIHGDDSSDGARTERQRQRDVTRTPDNDSVGSASSGEGGAYRNNGRSQSGGNVSDGSARSASASGTNCNTGAGPMTPRNDAGPFMFDGAARGRGRGSEEALVAR